MIDDQMNDQNGTAPAPQEDANNGEGSNTDMGTNEGDQGGNEGAA